RELCPLPFGRAADKGEAGRGCFSGRPAKSTPPRPSPSPPAKGRETSGGEREGTSGCSCHSPLAAQRTKGRLGGGAFRGARQKAPLPNPPLRLRRKGGSSAPSPLAAQRTRGRLG